VDPAQRQRDIDAALCRLGSRRETRLAGPVSSGSAAIDAALGTGGFPRGRLTEIAGGAAAGKTTLALHAIAACQRAGGTAALVDADHAFDAAYAAGLRVSLDTLLLARPDTGEDALEIVRSLAASGTVDLVVLDSVAALVSRTEWQCGSAAPPHLHRRLMAQQLRRVTRAAARGETCLLFLNQFRQKSGGDANPERSTGGPALGMYAAIRAEVRPVAPLHDGETLVGRRTRLRVIKNVLAPAYGEAQFDVYYGRGIGNLP